MARSKHIGDGRVVVSPHGNPIGNRDTPQQRAILRQSRTAQRVRAKWRPGLHVWSIGGEDAHRIERGMILRHIPMTNAQGGVLLVEWERTGTVGRHGPFILELEIVEGAK